MILRSLSVLFALICRIFMISLLFESRFSKKKTLIYVLSTLLPLTILNFAFFVLYSSKMYMTTLIFTLTLPSFVLFRYIGKRRNGRMLFTLCFVDTIILEIIHVTNILEYYIPGQDLFLLISRLIIYPLLIFVMFKYLRPTYLKLQKTITKGWYVFAITALLFYFLISLVTRYPTDITTRPQYYPVLALLFILMPVVYLNIFITLRHQQHIFDDAHQKAILKVQVSGMSHRIDAFNQADEKFRIERHDYRHKMQVIASLVERKQYDELKALIPQYMDAIDNTKVKRYCSNAVIDAVLSSYIYKAYEKGIKVTISMDFPEKTGVSETELATVFANAVENAIISCDKCIDDKYIDITVLSAPRFMIQISNSVNGSVEFDKDGIPVNNEEGHGFGTRSIVAFCEKNNAFYEFKTEDNRFLLRIVFNKVK